MKLEEKMYYIKVIDASNRNPTRICGPYTIIEAAKDDLKNNGWEQNFLAHSKELQNGSVVTATIESFNRLPD